MRGKVLDSIKRVLFLALVLPSTPAAAYTLYNPWALIKTPAGSDSQSIGRPNFGCLRGARKLEDGEGYNVMRTGRHRNYGHPALLNLIQKLAWNFKVNENKSIFVGDIAQPRGGPTMSAHNSHQTGLDADVWYQYESGQYRPTARDRATLSSRSIAKSDRTLSALWDSSIENLLISAAMSEDVSLVIVHPAVKKYFCENYSGAEWTKKLWPDWRHGEHFHVRINCPPGNTQCIQKPVSEYNWCSQIDSFIAAGPKKKWFIPTDTSEKLAPIPSYDHRDVPPIAPGCFGVFTKMPRLS
jgi:penicillin-insensitive murein endopeptidase